VTAKVPPPLFCRGLKNGIVFSLLLYALIAVLLGVLSGRQPRPLRGPLSSLPWMKSGCN